MTALTSLIEAARTGRQPPRSIVSELVAEGYDPAALWRFHNCSVCRPFPKPHEPNERDYHEH